MKTKVHNGCQYFYLSSKLLRVKPQSVVNLQYLEMMTPAGWACLDFAVYNNRSEKDKERAAEILFESARIILGQ